MKTVYIAITIDLCGFTTTAVACNTLAEAQQAIADEYSEPGEEVPIQWYQTLTGFRSRSFMPDCMLEIVTSELEDAK